MSGEKWHQRLIWLMIGAIITVIITAILTPLISYVTGEATSLFYHPTASTHSNNTTHSILRVTPSLSPVLPSIPQLKKEYQGEEISTTRNEITKLTIDVISQDEKGNITVIWIYEGGAKYSCTGVVMNDKKITLICNGVNIDYGWTLHISGLVYSDGHVEGKNRATNSNFGPDDFTWSVV